MPACSRCARNTAPTLSTPSLSLLWLSMFTTSSSRRSISFSWALNHANTASPTAACCIYFPLIDMPVHLELGSTSNHHTIGSDTASHVADIITDYLRRLRQSAGPLTQQNLAILPFPFKP